MAVAKVIEIISGSKKSFEDAVSDGIARATDSVSDVTGAWIKDQRVVVSNGKITEYRVVLKVTFVLKPSSGSKGSGKKR
jgi:dodecin